MKMIIRALFILALPMSGYAAGMQTQLENLYGEMSNVTSGGRFETINRGGFHGGRFTMKSRIVNENLVSFTPPSIKGGCGGIDMFGGSFSYVNSDQIVQLLRSVASNAKGYAFQLAMDNVCSNCMKWMNTLQEKIQKMNAHMGNSCQLAQGLVNDAVNKAGLQNKHQTDASLKASIKGFSGSFVEGMGVVGGAVESGLKALKDNNPTEFNNEQTGSLTSKAMREQNLQAWFTGGDTELIETVLSMTGSIVVSDLKTGSEGNAQTSDTYILSGGLVTLSELINGVDQVEIYDCSKDTVTNNCRITPSDKKKINLQGLKPRIQEAFTGAEGFISRIESGQFAGELKEEYKNILVSLPEPIGQNILQLAKASPDAAKTFLDKSLDRICLEIIGNLVNQSFRATRLALSEEDHALAPGSIKELDENKIKYDKEYQNLARNAGSWRDLLSSYTQIMSRIQKTRYVSVTSNSAASQN